MPPTRTTTSGGADPRTSNTLILFEEFVPLEYREQLAIKSASRRRLPSLFSTSGRKQWKQAATLNGRPYVIGHVPVRPSPREIEFEGLLHGNNSTRILSLNPKRSTSGLQNNALPSPSFLPSVPIIKVPTRTPETSAVHPRPPKSDETHSDATVSSPMKKSIFKANRKSMMPAEYSTVEFETRMASYSDDEANGRLEPEDVKQRRRESNADAWVDILVGSQDRFASQEAEMPDRKKRNRQGRRSDPDLARQEVAQVLAAVQNRSPSPPSTVDPVDRDFGVAQHLDLYVSDTDVIEVEHVPRLSNARSTISAEASNQEHDDAENINGAHVDTSEGDDILDGQHMLRQQPRLGYFDLHPERRKAQTQSIIDDPRDKFANDSDEEDDEAVYGPPDVTDVVRPLPIPPATSTKPVIHEPSPVNPAKSTALDLSQLPEVKAQGNTITEPSSGSKTAALIEMYRERERGNGAKPSISSNALPVAPLVTSRLPVRTSSLPKENPVPAPSIPSTNVAVTVSPPTLDDLTMEIPRIPVDESQGRASPGRYKHGEPLHNVLEEEEEET